MKLQGTPSSIGFCVADASFSRLCDALAKLPEVRFTSRRRFFVFAANIYAEFVFQGRIFRVQPDPWDGAWWVVPCGESEQLAELYTLREWLFGSHAAA